MKKKIAAALVCLLLVGVALFAVSCETPRPDYDPTPEDPSVVLTKIEVGAFVYEEKDGALSVYAYTGSDTDVIVPASVEIPAQGDSAARTLPVTAVGKYAFSGNTTVRTVTLPEGVTSVGADAFAGCTALLSLSGGTMNTLGARAFSGSLRRSLS